MLASRRDRRWGRAMPGHRRRPLGAPVRRSGGSDLRRADAPSLGRRPGRGHCASPGRDLRLPRHGRLSAATSRSRRLQSSRGPVCRAKRCTLIRRGPNTISYEAYLALRAAILDLLSLATTQCNTEEKLAGILCCPPQTTAPQISATRTASVVTGFRVALEEPCAIILPMIVGGVPCALGFRAFK